MQPDLDDMGGAIELALYRIGVAKEDLEAAEKKQCVSFREFLTE